MFETALASIRLMVAGKLFKDNREAVRLFMMGGVAGGVVMAVAATVLPLWGAAIIGGAVGGGLQPYLFRNIKYA